MYAFCNLSTSICLSIFLSIHPRKSSRSSIHPGNCGSIYPSIHPSIDPSSYLTYLYTVIHIFQSLFILLLKIANLGWPPKSWETGRLPLRTLCSEYFHEHFIIPGSKSLPVSNFILLMGQTPVKPVFMIAPSIFHHIFLPFFAHPKDLDKYLSTFPIIFGTKQHLENTPDHDSPGHDSWGTSSLSSGCRISSRSVSKPWGFQYRTEFSHQSLHTSTTSMLLEKTHMYLKWIKW